MRASAGGGRRARRPVAAAAAARRRGRARAGRRRRWSPVRVELTDLDGGAGTVLVLQDRTREREVERMKSSFLSNVSHELRTPLTPIRGYAEFLAARPGHRRGPGAHHRGHRAGREPEARAASSTCSSTSPRSRPAGCRCGRAPVRPAVAARAAAAGLARARAPSARRTSSVRGRRGPAGRARRPRVGRQGARRARRQRAAAHAGRHPGRARRAGPGPGGRVRVHVEDRGPGIAAADQRLLLSAFAQADGGATRQVGGLGLGLSFVDRLAQDGRLPADAALGAGRGARASRSTCPRPRRTRRCAPAS